MFQTLEILGLVAIGLAQGYIFYITFAKINIYREMLLPDSYYKICTVAIPITDINKIHPKKILGQLGKYMSKADEDGDYYKDARTEVGIIIVTGNASATLLGILESVNTYLIRNSAAAPDFTLIKDIVERTGAAMEEEINNTISVPLYLGLLGTLIGIIFGLFNISSISISSSATETTDVLNAAIPVLLGGVKFAMFASFTGLLLTVINSGIFYRKAKTRVENLKNDFYSFVQVELLPVLNKSINSSLASLQANLHKYNDDFTSNINKLSTIMHKNHDAIIAQDRVLTTLEKIDINAYAKANIVILKELQKSTDSFSKFNDYINRVTDSMELTNLVVIRLTKLIDNTDNMNSLAKNINASFAENNKLITFFNDHRTGLDESKAILRESVGGVSKTLKDAIAELNDTSTKSIAEIKQMVIREIKIMNEEYPKKWDKLEKLDKLDNLSALTYIKNDLTQFKESTSGQIKNLKNEMKDSNEKLLSAFLELKNMDKSNQTQGQYRNFWSFILYKKN